MAGFKQPTKSAQAQPAQRGFSKPAAPARSTTPTEYPQNEREVVTGLWTVAGSKGEFWSGIKDGWKYYVNKVNNKTKENSPDYLITREKYVPKE